MFCGRYDWLERLRWDLSSNIHYLTRRKVVKKVDFSIMVRLDGSNEVMNAMIHEEIINNITINFLNTLKGRD